MRKFKYLIPFLFLLPTGCLDRWRFVELDCELVESAVVLDSMLCGVGDACVHSSRIDTLCGYYHRKGTFDEMLRLHAQQGKLLQSMAVCCPDELTEHWLLRNRQHAEFGMRIMFLTWVSGDERMMFSWYGYPDGTSVRFR